MSKPIKDYTLGEAKEICDKHMADYKPLCYRCPLQKWCDKMTRIGDYVPRDWDLKEKPRWTQEEVEIAKAIKLLFGLPYLRRTSPGGYLVTTDNENSETCCIEDTVQYIPMNLFPSLKPGETVKLEEIINSGQEER